MDRFIVLADYNTKMGTTYLKSNMDRFIVLLICSLTTIQKYLKSNMDRFIAQLGGILCWRLLAFKIQYG